MITQSQLKAIMPNCKKLGIVNQINNACTEFGIIDKKEFAAFVSTLAVESSQLNVFTENLNYSAERLNVVFKKYFPTLLGAKAYQRQPEEIANRVYANRGGNGGEDSGDGWLHRGAGAIQLTFKNNQLECAKHFGIDGNRIGDWLRTDEGAIRSAAWYWKSRGISKYALVEDLDGIRDLVNRGHKTEVMGDSNGYTEFVKFYKEAKRILN